MRFQSFTTTRLLGLALLVFCTLGLMSGCKKDKKEFAPGAEWIAELRGRIKASVADPDKKSQMLSLVDQMNIELLKLDQEVRKHFANVAKIDRDYNATPDDFKKEFAAFNAARYEVRDGFLDARFKMRDLATREEWKELTDIKEKEGIFKELFQLPGQ